MILLSLKTEKEGKLAVGRRRHRTSDGNLSRWSGQVSLNRHPVSAIAGKLGLGKVHQRESSPLPPSLPPSLLSLSLYLIERNSAT